MENPTNADILTAIATARPAAPADVRALFGSDVDAAALEDMAILD
jgi:hypothetical protein